MKSLLRHLQTSVHFNRVRLFNVLNGQGAPSLPTIPEPEQIDLRIRLIMEEAVFELAEAAGREIQFVLYDESTGEYQRFPLSDRPISEKGRTWQLEIVDTHKTPDMEKMMDALGDGSVVVTGGFADIGVDPQWALDRIDGNNLDKFGPGGYRSDGTDGNPPGKWIKPKGHPAPSMKMAIQDSNLEGSNMYVQAIQFMMTHQGPYNYAMGMADRPFEAALAFDELWNIMGFHGPDWTPTRHTYVERKTQVEIMRNTFVAIRHHNKEDSFQVARNAACRALVDLTASLFADDAA